METEFVVLWDSDALIELLSGNEVAIGFHNAHNQIAFYSAITYAELIRGAGNNMEKMQIPKRLKPFHRIDIDTTVTSYFCDLVDIYSLSHGLQIPDALIAATSLRYGMKLVTCNLRHFRYIEGLEWATHDVSPVKRETLIISRRAFGCKIPSLIWTLVEKEIYYNNFSSNQTST